ncbi:MAG: undecaprenyl-diphosphatase [Burkholderiales bacterium]|nr:undecaprenyl-diphosphatase [Burkholderiales bacterium]
MEHLNQSLFLLLNAAPETSSAAVELMRLVADGLIWIVPVGLTLGWLRASFTMRQVLLAATVSGLTGLLINQLIALVWYHPRPFELGIGQTLMSHALDSSFPSDHLTVIWAVAFSLLRRERTRLAGGALVFLGLPVAWARIYLGVHFPLDILGAALVALCSAGVVWSQERRLIEPLIRLLLPPFRKIFSGLIRRGWAKQ